MLLPVFTVNYNSGMLPERYILSQCFTFVQLAIIHCYRMGEFDQVFIIHFSMFHIELDVKIGL